MTSTENNTKIYLGAGLFTQGDRDFNEKIAKAIRENGLGEVYSPAENMAINDKSNHADSVTIYQSDNEYLKETDVLIAVLDGDVVDAGLASEIGWFAHYAETSERPKEIIGLFTDIRQGQVTEDKVKALDGLAESPFLYVNLYVTGAIKSNGTIVNSLDGLLLELVKFNGIMSEYEKGNPDKEGESLETVLKAEKLGLDSYVDEYGKVRIYDENKEEIEDLDDYEKKKLEKELLDKVGLLTEKVKGKVKEGKEELSTLIKNIEYARNVVDLKEEKDRLEKEIEELKSKE